MEVPRLDATASITRLPLSPLSHFQFDSSKNLQDEVRVQAAVAVGHTEEGFVGYFEVKEPSVRALNVNPNEPVYQDSCVECFLVFLRHTNDKNSDHIEEYFNFEFNCIGTLLAAKGPSRTQREYLSTELFSTVKVWTSFPQGVAFEETKKDEGGDDQGSAEWHLTFLVPWHVIGISKEDYKQLLVPNQSSLAIKGNFYKCGDKLSRPHWITFFPIVTERPDFHRPESFQPLVLQSS